MSDGYPQMNDSYPQATPYPQVTDAYPQETGVPPQVSGESPIPLPADRPDVALRYGLGAQVTPVVALPSCPAAEPPSDLMWPPAAPMAGNTVYTGSSRSAMPEQAVLPTALTFVPITPRRVSVQDDRSWMWRVLLVCLALVLLLALGMILAD